MLLKRGAVRRALAVTLLSLASLSAMAAPQTFAGVITDSECDAGRHSHMQMGNTDAECTKACIDAHGARYVLWDGSRAYELTDQRTPRQFAGQKVTVLGTLESNGSKIQVDSVTARE